MTYKDKIKQIADQYGAYPQSIQAVEEMAELTQALTKFWRYKGTDPERIRELKNNIYEELADVQLMIEQLMYLYIGEGIVENILFEKIDRQLRRIAEESK